jgi:predicted signal transduction protein with EAL and GGDEF domain
LGTPSASDPNQLLMSADLALNHTKSYGWGSYGFFETEMDRHLQKRRSLQQDLRNALAGGEFEFHYQPLVNLARDEICGFEALFALASSAARQGFTGRFYPNR